MTLEFNKQGDIYVAEFTADAPFSLHVERDSVGYIEMLQNSVTGGKYDTVREFKVNAGDPVFDFDSGDFLGTKFIRIESEVLPTFAAVTTSGEVTEIKSQSKEVEVTSNGTMDITPDAGFSYLSAVKVKTNVATSGGGSGSSMEYIDVVATHGTQLAMLGLLFPVFAQKVRIEASELEGVSIPRLIGPSAFVLSQIVEAYGNHNGEVSLTPQGRYAMDTRYAAVDFNEKIEMDGQLYSLREYIILNGATQADIDALPRITESEFYDLNA